MEFALNFSRVSDASDHVAIVLVAIAEDNDHKVAKMVKNLVKAVKQPVMMEHHEVVTTLEGVDAFSNEISVNVSQAMTMAPPMVIKKMVKMDRMAMHVGQEIDASDHVIAQIRIAAVIRFV